VSQLRDLAEPFPPALVKKPPQGKYGDYVSHSTVTERALSIVRSYSQTVVREIYDGAILTGVVLRIEAIIDGRPVTLEEVGDVENVDQKKTNGARLKDAVSDAHKRAWMRAGLGLHLWSQGDYFLHKQLDKLEGETQ
jgi:hypothetical protein